ncbi:unnamed protein product [Owenia fusiformis]|uniref:Amino acid transporter n=1 Tax=Owenia fusiformis TaxID=6347 RepID=A0A8J1UXI4_OWEFU|nr:unnamed protein product [Owenia fusiformis]
MDGELRSPPDMELELDIDEEPTKKAKKSKGRICLDILKNNILLIFLILGMVLGIVMGIALRSLNPPMTTTQLRYFSLPGDLLLRMLRMMILPLIVSSLITGLASLDANASGKLGGRAVIYYFSTTIIAVILGIVLVVSIKPGELDRSTTNATGTQTDDSVNAADTALDLVYNMLPDNLVEATFRSAKTNYRVSTSFQVINGTNTSVITRTAVLDKRDGMNILGVLVFTIALGVVLSRLGERAKIIVLFFDGLNEAVMKLVYLVIWYSPIGVMFLIAAKLIAMEDIGETVQKVGMYTVTVLAGLGIHSLIILPLIYLIIVRKNPFKFLYGVLQALVTAFGTSSSSATLPVTFNCLEEKLGVDKRVTRFVLPIGATINMDGTALYEAVAAIFIAQINNIPLDIGQIITISLTATLASIGAAGIPQAGLVTMAIVLTAVNLPVDDIALIITVDWFLDRFRTAVNVLGDSIGAGVVEKLSHQQLRKEIPLESVEIDPIDSISSKLDHPLNGHILHNGNINDAYVPDHNLDYKGKPIGDEAFTTL